MLTNRVRFQYFTGKESHGKVLQFLSSPLPLAESLTLSHVGAAQRREGSPF